MLDLFEHIQHFLFLQGFFSKIDSAIEPNKKILPIISVSSLGNRKKPGAHMATRQVYKNPQAGQPLISTISTGCKTPVLDIKFCNLLRPFYYANSPTIPRYSITCVVDPTEHKEFLKGIQTIETNEKVESVIKNDSVKEGNEYLHSGKVLIKFQGKDQIPVYVIDENKQPQLITLEDELARGEKVVVVYDILRYTKKNTMKIEHGINFKPSCIYYYPSKPLEKEG